MSGYNDIQCLECGKPCPSPVSLCSNVSEFTMAAWVQDRMCGNCARRSLIEAMDPEGYFDHHADGWTEGYAAAGSNLVASIEDKCNLGPVNAIAWLLHQNGHRGNLYLHA